MSYYDATLTTELEKVGRKFFDKDDIKSCLIFFASSSLFEDLTDINVKPEKPPTLAQLKKKVKDLKNQDADKGEYLDKCLPTLEKLPDGYDKYFLESLYSISNFRTMWRTFVSARVFAVLARVPPEMKQGKDGTKKKKAAFKEPKKEDLEVAFSTMLTHCWNSSTNCHMRMEQLQEKYKKEELNSFYTILQKDLPIKKGEGEKYEIEFKEKKKNKEITTKLTFGDDKVFDFDKRLSQMYTYKVRLLDNIIAYKKGITKKEIEEQREEQLKFLDLAEKLDPKNVLISDQRAFIKMQQKKFDEAYPLFSKENLMIKLIRCYCLLMKNLTSDEVLKEEMLEALKLYEEGKNTNELFVPSLFASFKFTLLLEILAGIEEVFFWYYESKIIKLQRFVIIVVN
eukprot:gene1154-10668_t